MAWNQYVPGIANQVVPSISVPGVCAVNTSSNDPWNIQYNPSVMPPTNYTPPQYTSLNPEQQYSVQQNWQQWQNYQQQYAQWHAQYGEQYKKEMEVKLGAPQLSLPYIPSIPAVAGGSQYIPHEVACRYVAPPPPPDNNFHNYLTPELPPPPPPEYSGDAQKSTTKQPSISSSELCRSKTALTVNYLPVETNTNSLSEFNKDMQNQNKKICHSTIKEKIFNYKDRLSHVDTHTVNQERSKKSVNEANRSAPEEQIFDEQFKKWEQEFENWKIANANHPDKKAYSDYEKKFEDCRRKLIERREQMKRKKEEKHEPLKINDNIISKDSDKCRINEFCEKKSKEHEEQTKELLQTISINTEKKKNTIPGLDLVAKEVTPTIIQANHIETIDLEDTLDISEPYVRQYKLNNGAEELGSNNHNWNCNKNKKIFGEHEEQFMTNEKTENNFSHSSKAKIWNSNFNKNDKNYKIPSLLDKKIEKPSFSPPRKISKVNEGSYSNSTDSIIAGLSSTSCQLQQKPIENIYGHPISGESNNIHNLANALSDPNVIALLNAALQRKGQLAQENETSLDDKVSNSSNNSFSNNFMFKDNSSAFISDISVVGEGIKSVTHGNNSKSLSNFEFGFDKNSIGSEWKIEENQLSHDASTRNIFDSSKREENTRQHTIHINNQNNRHEKEKESAPKKRNKNSRKKKPLYTAHGDQANTNLEQNFRRNPFRNSFPSTITHQAFKRDDQYFRPSQIIDYHNQPVKFSLASPKNDTFVTNIVDYGHKSNITNSLASLPQNNANFFPIKTFDYGHVSNKNDAETIKSKQSFGDFLANRHKDNVQNAREEKEITNIESLQKNESKNPSLWKLCEPELIEISNISTNIEIGEPNIKNDESAISDEE